jgi:hypothetical protein
MNVLLSPGVIGIVMFLVSVVWMLRDENDRSRPILAGTVMINLFYGSLLGAVMGRADGLLPWKYDYYLYKIDTALGLSTASVVRDLGVEWQFWLNIVYQMLLPMMILWLARNRQRTRTVVFAYVSELIAGPVLYMILPAVGPTSTFAAAWLHPPQVQLELVRLSGMPNAFPSLHVATALVLVFFAGSRIWRGVSLVFLAGTALATLTTGEHYVIDLVAGLSFGCFAAAVGLRQFRTAAAFLALTASWSLVIRFFAVTLILHPIALRFAIVLTAGASVAAVWNAWQPQIATEQPDSSEVTAMTALSTPVDAV